MSAPQTIPVLERTVELLTAISESSAGLSAKQLTLQLSIPQATCYRILRTLVKCGWAREGINGNYHPAYGLARMSRSWSSLETRLQRVKQPLNELSQRTGLSVKISVCEGPYAIVVMRSETTRPNSITSPVGSRILLPEAGSAGIMLLAAMNSKEQTLALRKTDPRLKQPLLRSATQAGKHKIARSYGSDHPSIYAVSVPFDLGNRVVLSLVGWPDDFSGRRKKEIESILSKSLPAIENSAHAE